MTAQIIPIHRAYPHHALAVAMVRYDRAMTGASGDYVAMANLLFAQDVLWHAAVDAGWTYADGRQLVWVARKLQAIYLGKGTL